MAAAAGVFVAAERSLAFGARWRFHEEMRNRYNALIDQIEFIQYLPATERAKYLQEIWASLYALRARDAAIPGTGAASVRVKNEPSRFDLAVGLGVALSGRRRIKRTTPSNAYPGQPNMHFTLEVNFTFVARPPQASPFLA